MMLAAMPTTRRQFLAASGAASAGMLVRPGQVLAMPTGAKRPAPVAPPASHGAAADILRVSRLATDARLAHLAIDRARSAGASYADARLVAWKRERVAVRDDHIRGVNRSDEYGIGVRVLVDGGWGFAATHRMDEKSVAAATKQAVQTAKVNAKLMKDVAGKPVELAPVQPVKGVWISAHERDPFTVPIQEKAGLLIEANMAMLREPGVRFANSSVYSVREEKLFVSTDGTELHQLFHRTMPSMSATAIAPGKGFTSRNHEVAPMLAGWEYVEGLNLVEAAPQVAQDALRKLHAKSVEPGRRTVILAPSNLWLTIHESIGHPTELDRAMGLEANYAGTSFITPDKTGKLKIGSDLVNIVADRTQPGGLATTGWDDDGVPAQRWDIVKDGTFVGWQTTRDQASWIGEAHSRGCSYGDSYSSVAFQRMPNMSLQPGAEGYTTEDLINATEDGILISGRGSWSIDHQRYNFQFSGQFFWEIKRGRLTQPLRDVAYQANTVDFWNSCDMLGGKDTYRLGGSFNDGKGEPGQSNGVSHGCPPARFTVNIVNSGADK